MGTKDEDYESPKPRYKRAPRAHSMGSNDDDDWDPVHDINQALWRGFAFLATCALCFALFIGGLGFPLLKVTILPGTQGMETVMVKSVRNMIEMCFENSQYVAGLVLFAVTVGIPMLLFVGMLVIIYENFFAVASGWKTCFSPGVRGLVVSTMYICTSYQVVMIFLIMLFTCFFTGFGSEAELRTGFHFLAGYCLATIAMLQAMEFLKLNPDSDEFEEEPAVLPPVTGLHLRRNFSSFFPSLPGIKESERVDAWQVFFFFILFAVLMFIGFDQPLLDIRVMYESIALECRVLSLRDMIITLANVTSVPVVVAFVLFVVVIPVLYTVVLGVAGIFDIFITCCGCGDQAISISDWLIFSAEVLRPWVMTDVFSIALIIVLYAVQNEHVTASIPDGIVRLGPNGGPLGFGQNAKEAATHGIGVGHEVVFSHFLSGMYVMAGAGMSTIFLRWFWSTSSKRDLDDDSPRRRTPAEEIEENPVTRYVAGKSCRCLVVWFILCFGLEKLPLPASNFQFQTMNHVLERALPTMNKLLTQYTPVTVGHCSYPRTGLPQPCFEYGILAKVIEDMYRITAMWMSGFDTLRLTNVSIGQKQAYAKSSSHESKLQLSDGSLKKTQEGQPPVVLHRYVLEVKGVIKRPSIFLKIEECPKNHTTLKPVLGKGLCKPFLDTGDSCCEHDRHFNVQMSAECQVGDHALGNLRVLDFQMDTMTVRPRMYQKNLKVLIANKNITKMVVDTASGNIVWYMENEVFNISGKEFNALRFLNRVLKFNAPHQEFHCR